MPNNELSTILKEADSRSIGNPIRNPEKKSLSFLPLRRAGLMPAYQPDKRTTYRS
ncbi:hypothetical protein ACSAZL_01605 [Methanosarcina sp. T3]|uniref:hypothetical protein n=1 Tax=Methanosarcina sp. T3 TaxID=3439062 RepID=UPI003F8717C0